MFKVPKVTVGLSQLSSMLCCQRPLPVLKRHGGGGGGWVLGLRV